MWRDISPDDQVDIPVEGYRIRAYSFGKGVNTILCLNGGPGLPCDYLREAHSCLVDQGCRVVAFDQLGTGASDRPDDGSLWTIERYVAETEVVRRELGLGKVHILGHSWGGWLPIEYALTHPANLTSLILADTVADIPHLVSELERLRAAFGSETVAMMQKRGRRYAGPPRICGGYNIAHPPSRLPLAGMAGTLAALVGRLEHGAVRDHAGAERVSLYWQPAELEPRARSAQDPGTGARRKWRARRADTRLRSAYENGDAQGGGEHNAQRQPYAVL